MLRPPKVLFPELADYRVKNKTGFKDKDVLLAYIVIATDSDMKKIRQKITQLVWFEERFMVF